MKKKKIQQITLSLLLLVSISSFSQVITSGAVSYKMSSDNEEMAQMGEIMMVNSFDKDNISFEINMMGGMIVTKVYQKNNDASSTRMTMNAMGQKYEITNLEEDASKEFDMANLKDIESVVLDKKTTKKIAGYDCYKATVKYKDGKTGEFFVTDKIKSPSTAATSKLTGFPLEMKITSTEGVVTITATEFKKDLAKDAFTIPTDYEKVTQEELQQKMGGY